MTDKHLENKKQTSSNAGSFYLAGIGLATALAGAVFVCLMWGSFSKARATREWTELPCFVLISKVEDRSIDSVRLEYKWKVEYAYNFKGESYSGNLHTLRGSKWSRDKKKADELIIKYPQGEKSLCYVNPAAPINAILEHDSKAAGYSIWFPMLFVVGGLGITVSALRGLKSKANSC